MRALFTTLWKQGEAAMSKMALFNGHCSLHALEVLSSEGQTLATALNPLQKTLFPLP